MYFLFVDESGSPEASDASLAFALVGTAIHVDQYKKFTGFFNTIKHEFYPEIMDKPLTSNPKVDKQIRERQELKEILKHSHFDRRNERFMYNVLKHCTQDNCFSVHPVIFLKDQIDNTPTGNWVYPLAFKRLLTSFNNFLTKKNDSGIIILDSRDPGSDDKLVASFYSYTAKDPYGIACTKIVGPPFFARSLMTYGLQIAHHVAYIVFGNYISTYYRKKGGKDYAHLGQFWNFISDSALFGSINNLKGIIVWQ